MIDMWVIFALLFSFTGVLAFLVAEFSIGRVLHLLFWQRVFVAVLYVPVIFILPWPVDPVFYVAIVAGSILFAYGDLVLFGLIARDGAGVVSRIEPLSSWILFFLWTALTPALLMDYLAEPLRFAGIVLALTGCVFFSLRLRHCSVSWSVIKRILPVLFTGALGVSTSKIAMNHSGLHEGVFYYTFVQSSIMTILFGALLRLKSLPLVKDLDMSGRLWNKKTLIGGALMAVTGLAMTQPVKYYAISLAENPAYVMVFSLLGPFWIALVYKFLKRREDMDVLSGFGIVICTFLLVMFTQF